MATTNSTGNYNEGSEVRKNERIEFSMRDALIVSAFKSIDCANPVSTMLRSVQKHLKLDESFCMEIDRIEALEDAIYNSKHPMAGYVLYKKLVHDLLDYLHRRIRGAKRAVDILIYIYAAMDMGLISCNLEYWVVLNEFESDGITFSESSWRNYLDPKPRMKFSENELNAIKKEMRALFFKKGQEEITKGTAAQFLPEKYLY